MTRPAIPNALKRSLLVEAGHRCAIPTCRQTPTEFAHIVPWEERLTHEFENMIVLCPTCHTRYDAGQIDRLSIRMYKSNLSLVTTRYGSVEVRVLDYFAECPGETEVTLPGGFDILLMYLIRDGLLERRSAPTKIVVAGMPSHSIYRLTATGSEFVRKLREGKELEPEP